MKPHQFVPLRLSLVLLGVLAGLPCAAAPRPQPAAVMLGRQLADSIDAGDSYAAPDGRRKLLRLTGAVALPATAKRSPHWQRLTRAGGSLAGYGEEAGPARRVAVLHAPVAERRKQRRDPAAHARLLRQVRASAGGAGANPVFVNPRTGLRLLATERLIVCLKPGLDARAFFGAHWKQVRPLWGTTDQFVLTLPGATADQVFAEVDRCAADKRVAWAEPDFISQVVKTYVPDDPFYASEQWHLNNTGQGGGTSGADAKLEGAWDLVRGSSNVVVAIIDDGVQLTHPDLADAIFINPGESDFGREFNGIDDDNNGFVDDVTGWDFYGHFDFDLFEYVPDNDPSPVSVEDNHGTSIAGIIAATADNGVGVAGAAFGCRIMPLKVIEGIDGIEVSEIAGVVRYAAGLDAAGQPRWRGADILSISLLFDRTTTVDLAFRDAATRGRDGRGCVIFAAAGNGAAAWVPYEARIDFPGTYTLRWQYVKDSSVSQGDDTVWIDRVEFPDGTVEDFEDGQLPVGWTTSIAAPWRAVTNGVGGNRALIGAGGERSRSLRAGRIGHNQTTYVEVTKTFTNTGFVRFWAWVSSERELIGQYPGDQFHLLRDGVEVFFNDNPNSGVPQLETGLGYPALLPEVIAVGASTDFDYRADYSQGGATLAFVAPSDGGASAIFTTDRTGGDGYNYGLQEGVDLDYNAGFGGTSSSTPLAAGIAALALSMNPHLTASDVRVLMQKTCDKIGTLSYGATGRNDFYGFGRLNAQRAVSQSRPDLVVALAVTPGPADPGTVSTWTATARNQGASRAGAVTVTVTLPDSVTFGAATPGTFSRAGNAFTFTLPDLPAGASNVFRLTATNTAAGTLTGMVVAVPAVPDANIANNTVTRDFTVFPRPEIAVSELMVLEGDAGVTNAIFQVSLSNPAARNVTVRYATVTNTAAASRDFTPLAGTLTFLPGQTNRTVTVRVVNDRLDEHDEDFLLRLSLPVNATLGSVTQAVCNILDNDPLPNLWILPAAITEPNAGLGNLVFQVRLAPVSGRTVSVDFATAPGSAMEGADFLGTNGTLVFTPGQVLKTVTVKVVGDLVYETNETLTVSLANAVHANVTNATAPGTLRNSERLPSIFIADVRQTEGHDGPTNFAFALRLTARSEPPVSVAFTTTNGSAQAGQDYTATNGVLVFDSGQTNLLLPVEVVGDALSESNETFLVRLSAPVNGVLADPLALGTVLDDDPLPVLSIDDAAVPEPVAPQRINAVFNVSLSAVSGRTVTVRYATANSNALAGRDYLAKLGTLIFPPGTTNLAVPVTVLGNAIVESSNLQFRVNLTVPVNALLADAQGVGTIQSGMMMLLPAAAALVITDVRFTAEGLRLRFAAPAGEFFAVEHCDDLAAGHWQPLPGAERVTGAGGEAEVLDAAPAARARFYRVRLLRR
jgi:hypothetical protein